MLTATMIKCYRIELSLLCFYFHNLIQKLFTKPKLLDFTNTRFLTLNLFSQTEVRAYDTDETDISSKMEYVRLK